MNRIHLKSPKGWINDPNGFIYYKGQYHLFYQHFPYAPKWGRMHWGHAISSDLVNWEHKDIALFPSKTSDRSGCFSGSAVEYNEKLHIFYTGVNYVTEDPENINCCIDDDFISSQLKITSENGFDFDNLNGKKTVIPPIRDSKIGSARHTRDPKVWRGKNAWYMVVGSTAENKGRLLFYRSTDLENWEYVNFCEKDNFGWMWECPDYFEVDGESVIVFSPMQFLNDGKAYDSAAVCSLVDFDEESCKMTIHDDYRFFDYGIDLYAPQSTTDENGRRVIIAWARMPEAVDGKWIGMFCIPRIVEVKNGHIYFRPHTNISSLFTREVSEPELCGDNCFKLTKTLSDGESINIGGYVISRNGSKICTDRSGVFVGHHEIRCKFETPELKDGYNIEVYIDRNLIEVFVNGGEYVISNAVYGLDNKIIGKNYRLFTTK